MPMSTIDPNEGIDVIYRGERWAIWSQASDRDKVFITRPDPAGDETGGAPMECIEVLLADCERIPLPPADYDVPMFDIDDEPEPRSLA
jgi:hypothetical protein